MGCARHRNALWGCLWLAPGAAPSADPSMSCRYDASSLRAGEEAEGGDPGVPGDHRAEIPERGGKARVRPLLLPAPVRLRLRLRTEAAGCSLPALDPSSCVGVVSGLMPQGGGQGRTSSLGLNSIQMLHESKSQSFSTPQIKAYSAHGSFFGFIPLEIGNRLPGGGRPQRGRLFFFIIIIF